MSEPITPPPSPDAEPPLTDHEKDVGRAYVIGKRVAKEGKAFNCPYFGELSRAWRSGFIDGNAEKR